MHPGIGEANVQVTPVSSGTFGGQRNTTNPSKTYGSYPNQRNTTPSLQIKCHVPTNTCQVIQAVTLLSPSWRLLNPLSSGHVFAIPKRSRRLNHLVQTHSWQLCLSSFFVSYILGCEIRQSRSGK